MRNWIKSIIFECLREVVKDQPMIISNRPPTSDDLYSIGTQWKHGDLMYVAKSCNILWEPLNKNVTGD
jgi:hypothetical protein